MRPTSGNVHGYILNEGEREPIEGRLTYRGYNVYDLIHGLEKDDRFGFEEIGYLLMCGDLPTHRQLEEFQHVIGMERALPRQLHRGHDHACCRAATS